MKYLFIYLFFCINCTKIDHNDCVNYLLYIFPSDSSNIFLNISNIFFACLYVFIHAPIDFQTNFVVVFFFHINYEKLRSIDVYVLVKCSNLKNYFVCERKYFG